MNNHDEIIKSLSRRKSLSPDDQKLLSAARLEKARGLGITVSDCDLDLLSSYTWRIHGQKRVVLSKTKGQTIYLGRMIMSRVLNTEVTGVVTRTAEADNELDYRRSVLKLGSVGDNFDNELKKVKKFDVPTQYKGLYWNETKQKWHVKVITNFKNRTSKDWFTNCPHFGMYVLTTAYTRKKEWQDLLSSADMKFEKITWKHFWGSLFAQCKAHWDVLTEKSAQVDQEMGIREEIADYIVPRSVIELLKERGRAYAETAQARKEIREDRDAREYNEIIEKDEYGMFAAIEAMDIPKFEWKPKPVDPEDYDLGKPEWVEDRDEWDGGTHHYEQDI